MPSLIKRKSLAEAAFDVLSNTSGKPLTEAAIDTLQASAKENQEPMHHVTPAAGDSLQDVTDLGGATWEQPEGNAIGKVEAARAKQMRAPKGPYAVVDKDESSVHQVNKPEFNAAGEVDAGPPEGGSPGEHYSHPANSEEVIAHDDDGPLPGEVPGGEKAPPSECESLPGSDEEENPEVQKALRRESVISQLKSMPIDEDMAAMFNGSNLSSEFQKRVKAVFEAAVINRAVQVVESLEQEILEASEEAVKEIQEELEVQVDGYLDHMVTEWMNKNELSIEAGLKTEISEEFIGALRNLFVEHNINVPDEQVQVVETMAEEIKELRAKLNETLNNNVELSKRINEATKAKVFSTVSGGLTATQAEKFKTLAEGVDFSTAEEYQEKLSIIREQYFTAGKKVATSSPVSLMESADPSSTETTEVAAGMKELVDAMSTIAKR